MTLYYRSKKSQDFKSKKLPYGTTYKSAVAKGAELSGYGNFYLDNGPWVPSREEQLLQDVVPRRIKAHKTKQLTDID